jgi:hypothetical protein
MTVDFAHISQNLLTKRTYIRGGGTYIVCACTFWEVQDIT